MTTNRRWVTLVLAGVAAIAVPGAAWGQSFTFCVQSPTTLQGTSYKRNQTIDHLSGPPGYALRFDGGVHGLDQTVAFDALTLLTNGDFLFSTEDPVTLSGTTYYPYDVIRYTASSGLYSLYLGGASLGLSTSANIDALALDPQGRLEVSFDAPETIGGVTYKPNDVALVTGTSLSMQFSGSAIGLPPDLNVTGYERTADGSDLFQFDIPVKLGAFDFTPSDIARNQGGAWSAFFQDPSFPHESAGQDFSLPCVGPAYTGTLLGAKNGGTTAVIWTAGSVGLFDVVRGDISVLRTTGGDFRSALDAIAPAADVCMANDTTLNLVTDTRANPPAGSGYFYLLRPIAGCGGAGTYDSGAAKQVGSRDAEIAASVGRCP